MSNPYPSSPDAIFGAPYPPVNVQALAAEFWKLVRAEVVHRETFDRYDQCVFQLPTGLSNFGAVPTMTDRAFLAGLKAKSLICFNPGAYELYIPQLSSFVPPGAHNFVVACFPAIDKITLQVASGAPGAAYTGSIIATERVLPPTALLDNG